MFYRCVLLFHLARSSMLIHNSYITVILFEHMLNGEYVKLFAINQVMSWVPYPQYRICLPPSGFIEFAASVHTCAYIW